MFKKVSVIAVTVAIMSTNAVAETQWRIGANLASIHIDPAQDFNEFNPGAYLSISFRDGQPFQYGLQFGGYVNSYNGRTIYGLAFANWRVLDMRASELRLGAFTGLFEYPNLIEKAEIAGWPTVGNYVLALGPSLTWRMDNGVDITMGYLPIHSKETKGVVTLQTSIAFGAPRR